MQANKDSGVSPVIAVILMVAITVILSAVVYTWVSSFGEGNTPPRSIALSYAGGNTTHVSYIVTSASPTLQWQEMKFTMDGQEVACLCPAGIVSPAQSFTVPGTSGQRFVIVDTLANAAIATLTVR